MKFIPIDIRTWKRTEMFMYFSKMAPTGYSISFKVDVTDMKRALADLGYRFFPAYLWIVTKCLNRQEEFKIAIKDGVIGYYDELVPLYATFHEDDNTFSMMWNEYSDDFFEFHRTYVENQDKFGENHGVIAGPGIPPENAYTISEVPWISFDHFAVHSYENKPYYFPSVEAGKFVEEDGRILMPLSMTCHHASTDGYHIKVFISDMEKEMKKLVTYLTEKG